MLAAQLIGVALPRTAMAVSYYGPPFKMNVMGALGSFNTVAEAVNQSVAVAGQYCHSPCTVMYKYNDPNGSSWPGTAAFVWWSTSPDSPWYVDATESYANPMKLAGGNCAGGNGGAGLGSSPTNGSDDSTQDTAGRCPSTFEADPINTANGNKYQEETDFRSSAWLTFRRFYNSNTKVASAEMGLQWRHSFDRSLELLTASKGATMAYAHRPDASRVQFNRSNGVWAATADVTDTLIETDDALGNPTGYTYFVSATRQFEQYSAAGLLLSITDEAGLSTSLIYSTVSTPSTVAPKPGLLITVTDPKGRSLNFTYDSSGRVNSITLPDGGTVAYSYDGNMLASVTHPDGGVRKYVYNEQSLTSSTNIHTAMTGVIDERGVRFENTGYESTGKAISSGFAGGADATKVAYETYTSSGTVPATLTTPLGTTMSLGFKNILGAVKADGASKPCGNQCNRPWAGLSYDAAGRLSTLTDFRSNITATTFNSSGLETQRIEAKGTALQVTTNTTWDNALRNPLTRSILDAAGNQVAYQSWVYNGRGQVLAACDADPTVSGATTYVCGSATAAPTGVRQKAYSYCDTAGSPGCPLISLLLSATDALGNTTHNTYYATSSAQNCGTPGSACYQAGDLYQTTNALGQTTTVASYDAVGRPTRILDANGVVTDLTYTPRGWVSTRTAAGAKTSYAYDKVGSVTSVTDADGVAVSYTYDDAHRLTRVTDALGNYIQYTLDASGNRIAENTYATGASTPSRTLTRKFNALGQLAQKLDAQNRAISFTYDNDGNLTDIKDRLNIVTHTVYDAMSRAVSTTRNYNGTDTATKNSATSMAYDALGRAIKVTDPDSLSTSYAYDGLGNATGVTSPDTGNSIFAYDAMGNRIQSTDAKGNVRTNTYDALNRLTAASYQDTSANASYHYDETDSVTGCVGSYPVGRLTSLVESTVTTTYCYDAHGNLTQKRKVHGTDVDVVSYAYTPAGRLASIRTPDGAAIQYGRDGAGRINTITALPPGVTSVAAGNVVTSVSYMPFGPMASYTLGNGQTVTRTYDANYAVTDVVSAALNLHFIRDAMGNITALGINPGATPATETYSYDPLYRLTGFKDAQSQPVESYTFGKTGDRLSKASAGVATGTYGYQANTHWLTTVGSAARTYDANGATTGSAIGGDTFGYGYDVRNQVVVAQRNGQTVGTYVYDDLGQRFLKNASFPQSIVERFAYNETGQLLGEYGSSNRDYIWLDDVPVAALDVNGSTSSFGFIHADGLNTPRAIADSNGQVIWQWPYQGNAFGEQSPVSSSGYKFNLRFSGQYYDAETNLTYNVNRYYEPATGRYLQSDPLGTQAGTDTFSYVNSRPLNSIDPLGLQEEDKEEANRYERERLMEWLEMRLGPNLTLRSAADTRAEREIKGEPCIAPEAQGRGGVYRLLDPLTGNTVRTGRTNNLARREREHARDPVLGKYTFDVVFRTDVYDEQRGLEHMVYNQAGSVPFNYIRPISDVNPNRSRYLKSADEYLMRAASGQK